MKKYFCRPEARHKASVVHDNFTLIELLVVIAIIVILAGMLSSSLGMARARVRLTECKNNLRQIGTAFSLYMSDFSDVFPVAAMKPTVNTDETPISTVLESYAGGTKVFQCPADIRSEKDFDGGTEEKTFFESEGTSYEYVSMLGGRKLKGGGMGRHNMPASERIVMFDFECFHKTSSVYDLLQDEDSDEAISVSRSGAAKNYLFADWHVSDKL